MNADTKFSDHLLSCIREGANEEAQTILQELNPRELTDASGTTLLHIAAECGNIDITKYLIDRGCKVDALDNDGNTPLMRAVDEDYIETINVLIEANASVFVDNNEGKSPAKVALDGGKILSDEVWEAILQRVKDECSNDSSQTAEKLLEARCLLSRAMMLMDVAITKLMLENGCNVDERDTYFPHFTPLQQAIACSDRENVKLLIDRGADVDASVNLVRSAGGVVACWIRLPILRESKYVNVNLEIFKILLARGASLGGAGFARLLLKYLMRYGTKGVVNFLVSLDLGREDQKFDLLAYLASNRNFDPVDEIRGLKLNINGKATAVLSCAVKTGNVKSVKLLLRKGVDPNGRYPVLFFAFGYANEIANCLSCVKALLEHGTDVQCVFPRWGGVPITIFHCFRSSGSKNYEGIKFVLARLAVVEALGCEIKDFVLAKIDADAMFKKYFKVCRQKVDKMKRAIIHDSVTQFEFLTVNRGEIVKFARNKSLLSRLQLMVNYKRRSKFYCYVILRERAMKAIEITNLRESAYDTVAQIQGLQQNAYVIRKIADYYIYEELQNVALA